MSREWRRALTNCFCGYCGPDRPIPKGEPAMFIIFQRVKKPLIRCQQCAGEPAPTDLPPLLTSGGIKPSVVLNLGRPKKQTAREWTPYAEREPSSEG